MPLMKDGEGTWRARRTHDAVAGFIIKFRKTGSVADHDGPRHGGATYGDFWDTLYIRASIHFPVTGSLENIPGTRGTTRGTP